MIRKDFVLACLSLGNAIQYSPVQLQKLFFLLDRNLGASIEGPHFNFEPYMYGPFDKEVYGELDRLAEEGMVTKVSVGKWREFVLTQTGMRTGQAIAQNFSPGAQAYIQKAIHFVTTLSFRELVSAIYETYPDMRRNSVFLR